MYYDDDDNNNAISQCKLNNKRTMTISAFRARAYRVHHYTYMRILL